MLVPRDRTGSVLELGAMLIFADRMTSVATAEEVIAQLILETHGAYERVVPSPRYDLPPGFDATALLRVTRNFNISGTEPGRVLNNWQGVAGSTLRVVVRKDRDRAVVAYLESADWSGAEVILPYLAQIRLLP